MDYRRLYVEGGCYAFTMVLNGINLSTLTDNIAKLRQAFRIAKRNHPFDIHAIAVMPDHLHMLISLPEGDCDYSIRISQIKSNFSRQIPKTEFIHDNRSRYRHRGIWQKRFWEHTIRDEADFENQFNYIHYNPVKHGLVEQASKWPFSSIHRYIKQGILADDWGFNGVDINGFGE